MKAEGAGLFVAILCGMLIASGCAKYKITHELEQPITKTAFCSIGEIEDELPANLDADDKPTFQEMDKFRRYLKTALGERVVFQAIQLSNPEAEAEYEVTGSIRDFKKRKRVPRFSSMGLGEFDPGNTKVMVELKLQDRKTGEILFSGNFKQEVSNYKEKADVMFERIAKVFAKALQKQTKKLEKKK
jgi:hypothetical protein